MSVQTIVFLQTTVDNAANVPHWGYVMAEPGASWVAAAITEPGWKSIVIDADEKSDEEVMALLEELRPTVIGFSCYTAGFPRALRLCGQAKRRLAGVFCIFGGWHPSLVPESVLEEADVDAVAVGQGERFINDLLQNPKAFANQIVRSESYPPVERLPIARRQGESFAKFSFFGAPPLEQQRSASIVLAGGGCAFQCTYCSTPAIYGRAEVPRSLDAVMAEIRDLVEVHAVNFIFIRDEDPPIYKRFLVELCEALVRSGLNEQVRFYSFGDTRLMTEELLNLMAEAGWCGLDYGVESFNPEQLRNLRRHPNPQRVHDVFRWTQKAGIFATANLILWQPGDTVDVFESTAEALKRLRPDEVYCLFFSPFPGTVDGARYADYPRRSRRLEDYHLLTPILELDPAVSTDELVRLRREMLASYYLSKDYSDLIESRKQQFGEAFWTLTQLRRERMLHYGIDLWELPHIKSKQAIHG